MHGFRGPLLFHTDRCCDEQKFWCGDETANPPRRAIFDSLKRQGIDVSSNDCFVDFTTRLGSRSACCKNSSTATTMTSTSMSDSRRLRRDLLRRSGPLNRLLLLHRLNRFPWLRLSARRPSRRLRRPSSQENEPLHDAGNAVISPSLTPGPRFTLSLPTPSVHVQGDTRGISPRTAPRPTPTALCRQTSACQASHWRLARSSRSRRSDKGFQSNFFSLNLLGSTPFYRLYMARKVGPRSALIGASPLRPVLRPGRPFGPEKNFLA